METVGTRRTRSLVEMPYAWNSGLFTFAIVHVNSITSGEPAGRSIKLIEGGGGEGGGSEEGGTETPEPATLALVGLLGAARGLRSKGV